MKGSNMKKFVIILLAVCLLIGGAAMYFFGKGEAAVEKDETAVSAEEMLNISQIDLEAMYALHGKDDTVATINGEEIPWSEYYYWLASNAAQVQNYITQMAYYGMEVKWDDLIEEGGSSYAEYVLSSAESSMLRMHTIEQVSAEHNVTLTDEDRTELAETLKSDIAATCGEDATEEAFKAFLEENYLDMDFYTRLNSSNHLYQNGFTVIFGENGEKVSDEEALKYIADNGLMNANHILFMTIDPETREELDEAKTAEKKAKADQVYAELAAIEDTEELLKRFRELKDELDEDTGKVSYPDGYVFGDGEMVPEFENAVKSLDVNCVCEPVKSSYGYHIIIRLADDPDKTIEFSSSGTPLSARTKCANEAYGKLMQEKMDSLKVEYLIDSVDILSFVK